MTQDELPTSETDAPAITPLDRRLGPLMFGVTTAFLAVVALAVQLVSDETDRYGDLVTLCGWVLVMLWPLYALEALAHWYGAGRLGRLHGWACIFPPLRIVARDHGSVRHVWLPGLGWQPADDALAERIEFNLGYPMIGVALLILPLLAVEQFAATAIQGNAQLGLAIQIAGALIWLAFTMEFLVMVSLVSRKLKFVKAHWLDLAIICLPLIAFLRSARIGRVLRLHQLGKLTKTARMFRLRGLALRAWRAILILEIVDRIIHRDPHKRLRVLEEEFASRRTELSELEAEIAALRVLIAEAEQSRSAGNLPEPG